MTFKCLQSRHNQNKDFLIQVITKYIVNQSIKKIGTGNQFTDENKTNPLQIQRWVYQLFLNMTSLQSNLKAKLSAGVSVKPHITGFFCVYTTKDTRIMFMLHHLQDLDTGSICCRNMWLKSKWLGLSWAQTPELTPVFLTLFLEQAAKNHVDPTLCLNLGFIILTITIRWISLYFYHHFNHICSFLNHRQ